MTDTRATAADRPKLGVRTGSSRKLLARKAQETAQNDAGGDEALEASFPPISTEQAAGAGAGDVGEVPGTMQVPSSEPQAELPRSGVDAAQAPASQLAAPAPTTAASWSAEDESTLQSLLARRKAAGYQRRGRDVGDQRICVGEIKPNVGTVVASIASLVAERGTVTRADLIDAMACATFSHAKAKPRDRGWCQGYVAGALRDGYLALSAEVASDARSDVE